MVKFFLYIVSILNICLILVYSPANNPSGLTVSNQIFNIGSNQDTILRAIVINILLFFILAILYANSTSS